MTALAEAPTSYLDCQVVSLEQATSDIRILRLAPPTGVQFAFRAGQYASLTFGDLPPRDFSMASRPDEPLIEFHVRQMGDEGPSAYVAQGLKLGDNVRLEGPFGGAWLREDHEGPILALAGGSGLAPIKSIVETALAKGMRQPIHLYFGARSARDLYFVEHFQRRAGRNLSFRYVPLVSEPGDQGGFRHATISAAVAEDFQELRNTKAYLAGPPAMVETAVEVLRARGVDSADIHADPFYADAEKAAHGLR